MYVFYYFYTDSGVTTCSVLQLEIQILTSMLVLTQHYDFLDLLLDRHKLTSSNIHTISIKLVLGSFGVQIKHLGFLFC